VLDASVRKQESKVEETRLPEPDKVSVTKKEKEFAWMD